MNTTGLDTIISFQSLASYTNSQVDGLLFTGGVFVFFIILLMILIRNETPIANALAVSSWAMFIISAFFWIASLLPTMIPLAFLFIAAFSTFYLYASA